MVVVGADPLSIHAATGMEILLVIMFVTIGLALRAGAVGRRASLVRFETSDENSLLESYARTSLLVLFCLLGLFALGLMYGNVLSAGT